tara:strand:- start:2607 stop:2966 length:360 start_codon:yes stop_codon:yes gene_type:complete
MIEKDSKKLRGGARPGAGRPKGSTERITARLILETAEKVIGKPLLVSILEGYHDTLLDGDRRNRTVYEKMLLDKVSTTLLDVDVSESEDLVTLKREAFAAAIAAAVNRPTELDSKEATK